MIKGHSKTPLLKKLGIKDHMCLILWNEPIWFREMLVAEHSNLKFLSRANQESADFIQIFIKSKSQLVLHLEKYKKGMRKHGMLWVAWPKGKSGIETDLSRDWIRNYILENGMVDVKIAAIDTDWSALKFVYRLKDR